MPKLPDTFYLDPDVIAVSRRLLGKFLITRLAGAETTGGMIVETEAYAGPDDRASHAFGNRRTPRTSVMFQRGGVAYVYLCYGIHSLFNVITNVEGIPHAVLIRAIQPTDGVASILRRRNASHLNPRATAGPGALTRALGINCTHSGLRLTGSQIWIEDRGVSVRAREVVASPRVGVDYAGNDAKRPWRFRLRDNPWTSRAK